MFNSWRQTSTDPKDHFIPQKYDLLLSFLVPEKPFSVPLTDMSVWASSTCLRQEVFLSASCPGRDPWSQPQIFPRWHLYWRMHPVVGQMFLAEVQGQNKWALFSRPQDTKRATHWKPILDSQHNLGCVRSRGGHVWMPQKEEPTIMTKILKKIRTSSRNSGHRGHCCANTFLSWDKYNSYTLFQAATASDIKSLSKLQMQSHHETLLQVWSQILLYTASQPWPYVLIKPSKPGLQQKFFNLSQLNIPQWPTDS